MLSPPDGLAPTPATTGRRRSGGFTLVELLMVIGIIAVLAALVLTVRSRASDQARAAQCMNNLRQIGLAMTLYAQNNEQAFPFSADHTPPVTMPPTPPGEDRKADWIHFRATEDDLQKKVNGSAIATHAKVKGPAFINMMRCPADEVENHQTHPAARFPYRFSYVMNIYMSSDAFGKGYNRSATPRTTSISRAGEKILVVEENSGTINDGNWDPGEYQGNNRAGKWNVSHDFLSIRHDVRKADNHLLADAEGNFLLDPSKRGNVLFVDGHAEFVSRLYAHTPKHLLVTDEGPGVPSVKP